MGAGHWFPKPHNEADFETEFRMVYLDLCGDKQLTGIENEVQAFDAGWRAQEEFEDLLATLLPRSFVRVEGEPSVGDDRRETIFAQNGQLMVTLASNEWLTAVVVRSRDDLRTHEYRIAEGRVPATADKIFDALAKHYDLSWRTGPHCSAPYVPSAQRA